MPPANPSRAAAQFLFSSCPARRCRCRANPNARGGTDVPRCADGGGVCGDRVDNPAPRSCLRSCARELWRQTVAPRRPSRPAAPRRWPPRGNGAQIRNCRQQETRRILGGGRNSGKRPGSGHEHGVGDPSRLHGEHAQTHAGKNIGVVRLRDGHGSSVPARGRKRAARADERAAFGPRKEVGGRGLAARCGIGKRKDQGARDMARHLADRVFLESAGLAPKRRSASWDVRSP